MHGMGMTNTEIATMSIKQPNLIDTWNRSRASRCSKGLVTLG